MYKNEDNNEGLIDNITPVAHSVMKCKKRMLLVTSNNEEMKIVRMITNIWRIIIFNNKIKIVLKNAYIVPFFTLMSNVY